MRNRRSTHESVPDPRFRLLRPGLPDATAETVDRANQLREQLFLVLAGLVLTAAHGASDFYPFTGVVLNPMIAAGAMALSSVSVVTNALRLRGFKRPKDADEIAHPSLWSRATDYAYLVLIGLFGILAGVIAFNVLPRDEMAAMGMGGSAAAQTDVLESVGTYAVPSRTVVLRGGETLEPNPANLVFPAGETVAFVNSNDTQEDRIFAIGEAAGGHAMESSATLDGVGRAPRQVVVRLGQTVTLTYQFGDGETPVYAWEPAGGHRE